MWRCVPKIKKTGRGVIPFDLWHCILAYAIDDMLAEPSWKIVPDSDTSADVAACWRDRSALSLVCRTWLKEVRRLVNQLAPNIKRFEAALNAANQLPEHFHGAEQLAFPRYINSIRRIPPRYFVTCLRMWMIKRLF
jgi:hypothetical protein